MILAIFTGVTLFLASLMLYFWAGSKMHSETARRESTAEASDVPPNITINSMLADARINTAYRLNLQENLTYADEIIETMKTSLTENQAKTYKIDRKLRLTYSRSQYMNQTFELRVVIASESGHLPSLQPKEQRASEPDERLQFEAYEQNPLLQVEVQFAQGDFNANTTKQQKPLEKDVTIFTFVLKPLKAEDCILTVVISYIPNIDVPEQITQRVTTDKTIDTIGSSGTVPTTSEHTEQVTTTPATATPQVVKTDELVVTVKSLFGMNTDELTFCKNGLGIGIALVLLAIVLISKQTIGADDIAWGIAALANVLGIPLIDSGAKLIKSS